MIHKTKPELSDVSFSSFEFKSFRRKCSCNLAECIRAFIIRSMGVKHVCFTYIWYPIEQIIVPSFQRNSALDTCINRHHVVRLVSTVTFPVHAPPQQASKGKTVEKAEGRERENNSISISKWEIAERNIVIVIISRNLLSKRNDKKHATGRCCRWNGKRTLQNHACWKPNYPQNYAFDCSCSCILTLYRMRCVYVFQCAWKRYVVFELKLKLNFGFCISGAWRSQC